MKLAKKDPFKKYCTELNSFIPTGEVLKKVKAFTNIHYSNKTPPMEVNSVTHYLRVEKANLIADVYEVSFNVNQDGRVHYTDERKSQLAIENNNSDLNTHFLYTN